MFLDDIIIHLASLLAAANEWETLWRCNQVSRQWRNCLRQRTTHLRSFPMYAHLLKTRKHFRQEFSQCFLHNLIKEDIHPRLNMLAYAILSQEMMPTQNECCKALTKLWPHYAKNRLYHKTPPRAPYIQELTQIISAHVQGVTGERVITTLAEHFGRANYRHKYAYQKYFDWASVSALLPKASDQGGGFAELRLQIDTLLAQILWIFLNINFSAEYYINIYTPAVIYSS